MKILYGSVVAVLLYLLYRNTKVIRRTVSICCSDRSSMKDQQFWAINGEKSRHVEFLKVSDTIDVHESSQYSIDFYRIFWERTMQIAMENNNTLGTTKSPGIKSSKAKDCPKVYVYDLPSEFRDAPINKVTSAEFAFGVTKDYETPIEGTSLRNTSQYGLGVILEHRLRQMDSCYYTNDPMKADLVFLPILTLPKGHQPLIQTCQRLTTNLSRLFHEVTASDCRHFMAMAKGHYNGLFCTGWYSDPVPALQPAMRLAYSHTLGVQYYKAELDPPAALERARNVSKTYPNLFSVPYPSSLHFFGGTKSIGTPWNDDQSIQPPRKYLMSFIGTWDHGDIVLRQRIRDLCQGYNETSKCKLLQPKEDRTPWLVKRQSIFCLEPVGDSPWRKSLSDSITFGCIPVLFSYDTDNVAPWFWDHWKNQSRILLGEKYRQDFLQGRIDLYDWLSSIPPTLLALMQTTIARFRRQFQYSLTEDRGDGIHIMLEKMKEYAQDKQRQGLCGPTT